MRISDWSSDVCSSDLGMDRHAALAEKHGARLSHRRGACQARPGRPGRSRTTTTDEDGRRRPRMRRCGLVLQGLEQAREAILGRQLLPLHLQQGGVVDGKHAELGVEDRSEEHTSEIQSLMLISYAVFCLKNINHSKEPLLATATSDEKRH